jgi:hypothetical protein
MLGGAVGRTGKESRMNLSSINRVLFLGNSITLHPPKPDIGWTDNWGMAASAEAKDYVHLLLERMAGAAGARPEAMVENAADFEREHATYDGASKFRKAAEFKADVIVVALGENVPALSSPEAQDKFRKAFAALLATLKGGGRPALFVRSSFWPDKTKDAIMRQVCAEAGGTFVDLSGLGGDESLFARSERKIQHDGVGIHPGDKGMKAIADLIWKAISAAASGEPRAQVGAYYFDGWAGRHKLADTAQWAAKAPTHLTERMLKEFPGREPAWGWRDFCWYWRDDGRAINRQAIASDPLHTSLGLYLKARNNRRLKFCLLVANHQGAEIKGAENWRQAAEFWTPYFRHPQHVTVGGKPLVIIFDPGKASPADLAGVQGAAKKAGLPGLAIAACGSVGPESGYTHQTRYNVVPGYNVGSEEHKYAELAAANMAAWGGSREQPCMPIVTAGWDKRPWEGPTGLSQAAGWYYPDRTPEQFADFLRKAVAWMDGHPEQTTAERIVLVYAWNEFGEGGHIAPTKEDPEGRYLKAIKSVVKP